MRAPPVAKPKATQPQRSTVVAQGPRQSAVSQPIPFFSPGGSQRFQTSPFFPAPRLPIQAKLKVGAVNDPLEHEADRVADQVMHMPASDVSAAAAPPQVSRKCVACEAEEKEKLQRKEAGTTQGAPSEASASVHEVLRSPGQPLDAATRAYFEPRFGQDFSPVKVHRDAKAAESAQAVGASAFTVGRNIVFGPGRYAPQTDDGRKLLAHELTHVVQQAGSTLHDGHSSGTLQRVCSKDPECQPEKPGELPGTAVKGSATHFGTSVEREEKEIAVKKKRKTPEQIRKEFCRKTPPDPRCTSDGHGRRATAFEAVFHSLIAAQSKSVTGVFVDMDMPSAYGAYFWSCSSFTPAIAGDKCIFIPDYLEKEAARYQKGEKEINGREREDWRTHRLSTLTHEFEHARFDEEFPSTKPRPEACDFFDVSHELSELAAEMSEFPVHYRALAKKSWKERRLALDDWFNRKITQPQKHGETIAGIVKAISCRCECDDVHAYIKRVVDFVTTGKWTEVEKNTFHTELRDPKWGLDWPIETPLPPSDLPGYLLRPHLEFGYSRLSAGGISFGLGLDVGIPVDRLGKWQVLLGAQGRLLGGLSPESQSAYLLGLKFGFLKGPALGAAGFEFGLYGEAGGGSFQEGLKTEKGAYVGGGLSLAYRGKLGSEGIIPFLGLELAGGARVDLSKPAVQRWFVSGVTASFGFEF